MKRIFLPTLVVFLVAALPSQAAYNPAIVSADARWVIFADLNALRTSTLGKELVSAIEKVQTESTSGMIGIDVSKVLTTIGTLTAYGTNLSSDPKAIDGALIAEGTADLRKIAESAMLQGTLAQPAVFSEMTELPFPAYAISDPKAPADARVQLIVAFPPEPIVIVSKSKTQVSKARDVYRGSAASLQKASSNSLTQLASNTHGAYVFAAATVPSDTIFPPNAPQARILQLANSGSIALGERNVDTFAQVDLVASSDQNAEKLMKILQGMTAMLSLAESNDRQLSEFLNATSVSRERDTVVLKLAYPSARLVQMTQQLRSKSDNRAAARPPSITSGKVVDEWRADEAGPSADTADNLSWRTVENVKLLNGSTVTLGRQLNGGKSARFDRVEISPADGTGAPLVFRSDFMRNTRGTMSQFQFPGADGTYTLKVAYTNDPDGKAKFAVSISDPKPPAPAPR